MRKQWLYVFLPLAVASVLFFGCGSQPGEKFYYQALTQWEAGNFVRARALLEKSINRRTGNPVNAEAYNRLGLLLWEMGEVQLAIDAFNDSLRVIDGEYDVLCNLGVALSGTTNFAAAENAFREAALLHPEDSRPLAYAGLLYAKNEKWAAAGRNLKRAISRTPDDLQLQTALALTELHTEGAQPALQRLQTIIQKDPYFSPALFNTATIYHHWLGDSQRAKLWFERYLQQASGIDAFSDVARAQLESLKKDETPPPKKVAARKPKARDRKTAELYFQRASQEHRNGKIEEAIRGYTLTLQADNSYERAYYNLGLIYYTRGQMTLAGESFKRAVRFSPTFVDARYNLALVNHYHLGETTEALRELEMILSQQPSYQPALDLINQIQGR